MEKADHIRVTFRCPAELHELIKESAESKEQSLNSEMIKRLQQSFINSSPEFTEHEKALLATHSHEIIKLATVISKTCLDISEISPDQISKTTKQ